MEIGITPAAIALVFSTVFVGVTTPVRTYIGISGNPNLNDPMWNSSQTKKQPRNKSI